MKSILIPTDFSEHAKNAGYYGVELAKALKAKLSLLHTYNLSASDLYPPEYSGKSATKSLKKEELTQKTEKENEIKLKAFREAILKGKSEPSCKLAQSTGFVSETVNKYAESKNIDLIVMGTKGKENRSSSSLAPITFDVINAGVTPVLAVNEDIKFKKVSKVAIAINAKLDIIAIEAMETVLEFVKANNADLIVLWCNNDKKGDKKRIFNNSVLLEANKMLENINWDVVEVKGFENDEELAVMIDEYICKNNIDLLSLITRKQNLFKMIYQNSQVKSQQFHKSIPLLTIPGV